MRIACRSGSKSKSWRHNGAACSGRPPDDALRAAQSGRISMTRRTAYLAIGGALLCLFALWFTHNYAVVNEEVWTGMRPEAAFNPLLAGRMLLQRMGSKV